MRINLQPAEKQTSSPYLHVHSVFHTIQGEGPFCGQPAVFVRLAGCNLQCPGCDTDYTSKRMPMLPQEIVALVWAESMRDPFTTVNLLSNEPAPQRGTRLVVITGGEPFRQDLGKLVRLLVSKGYRVQIETNGTLFQEGLPWDSITVVCSPKTGKVNERLLPRIDAFKYVLHAGSIDQEDGLPELALGHSAAPRVARPPAGNTKPVYVQPMDAQSEEQNEKNLRACIASCMKFGYTLQLQIHKIINME
jgi:organic radical activating enzyme